MEEEILVKAGSALSERAHEIGQIVDGCPTIELTRVLLTVAIDIIVSSVSDSTWERLVEIAGDPCDQPMCRCHIDTKKVIDVLNEVRPAVMAHKKKAMEGWNP